MRTIPCLALALLALGASSAHADEPDLPGKVVVLMNPSSTANESQRQMALVEVGNVLRERGVRFEVEADASCTETSNGCLALIEGGRAEAVLIVSVYHGGDEGSIDLQVFDGQMSGVGTQAWVGDPSSAAGRAMRQALDSYAPEYVRIAITGEPEGASVLIGGLTGELPFIGRVRPGQHRLRISADGHRTLQEELDIPATTETWAHRVTLEPGEDPDDLRLLDPEGNPVVVDDQTSTSGSGRGALLGLGAAGLGAGLALAITGAVFLAKDGDCAEDGCPIGPDGLIEENQTAGLGLGLLIGGGVLAIAGGTLLVIGATRVEASAGPGGANLRLTTRF